LGLGRRRGWRRRLYRVRHRVLAPDHRRRKSRRKGAAAAPAAKVAYPAVLTACLRRNAVDAGSTVLAGQPIGLHHPVQIDDVVERVQRRPPFRPRRIGYPLSVRRQVCGVQSPLPCFRSTVLYSWRPPSLERVPASPVPRGQQYYAGATTSPSRIPGHLFVSLPGSTLTSSIRVSRVRAPEGAEVVLRARAFCSAGNPTPARSDVDMRRISQVPRRSIPCLCSVPRPRSNRRALAIAVTPVLPPLCAQRRLRAMADFGADSRSFGTCCPTLRVSRCRSHARLASGWPARPLPGGCRTLWTAARGFSSC